MNGASGSLQGIDEGIDGWARRVSAELCAVLLDTLGLPAAIEWHVRRFSIARHTQPSRIAIALTITPREVIKRPS